MTNKIKTHRFFMLVLTLGMAVVVTGIFESCKPRNKSSSLAAGEGDPYLFVGGSCQTSGRWVDAAIQQAEQIKAVINGLRNNPACTAMVNSMDSLVTTTADIGKGPGPDPKGAVAQMFAVSREITAISDYRRIKARYANNGPGTLPMEYNVNIDKMLTDRMFQITGLNQNISDAQDGTSSVRAVTGAEASAMSEAGLVVNQVIDMKARALQTASAGLDVATTVFNNLATDQSCLVGKTPAIGTMAIAGAKLLGAYVGADNGLSAKAGSAIAAYFRFIQNQKFSNAINAINETEFLMSISCLMETTSNNYCAVRDARYLQEDLIPKVGGLKSYWAREENVPDMMTGFKVINQDVPVVADWLRKVVTGVTPRRKSDADYYNSVMGSLNGLQQVLTTALTSIAETKYNFPKDDAQQRASILALARVIQGTFSSAGSKLDSSGTGSLPDFYVMASPDRKQLFDILGMDLPIECDPSKNIDQNKVKDPNTYLEAGGAYTPLASPQAILDRMEGNVKLVFDRMSMQVTAYVRNNLNIDQPNVATDFVTPSASGNASQRLRQIRSYLVSLLIRISNSVKNKTATTEDKSFARLFMDTITRIDRVLDAQLKIDADADQIINDGSLDQFIEDAKAKDSKYNGTGLALDGTGAPQDLKTSIAQKRAKYKDRYGPTGALATAEDKSLYAAMNIKFPGDTQPLSEWFIDQAAYLDYAVESAKKVNNPRIRADRSAQLALGDTPNDVPVMSARDQINTEIYGTLLNAAFDQFDMLRFREAFFINRISKAVYWDLSKQMVMMQQDYLNAQNNPEAIAAYKTKWSGTTQKLMIMMDNFVVDKINGLIPRDQQAAMIDQSKAVAMNQTNLTAMLVFKDPLLKQISRLKSIVEKGHTSDWQIYKDLVEDTIWNPHRAMWNPLKAFAYANLNDPKIRRVVGRSAPGEVLLRSADLVAKYGAQDYMVQPVIDFTDYFSGMIGRHVRPDLYWSPYQWTDKTYFKDDEFGSLATFRGLLCMQTLSFADPTPFAEVCKGANLQSVFEKRSNAPMTDSAASYIMSASVPTLDPDALSLDYDTWMAAYLENKPRNDFNARQFEGRRICAVYDHLRNNNIHMMKLRNISDRQISSALQQNLK